MLLAALTLLVPQSESAPPPPTLVNPGPATAQDGQIRRPNIIYIMADDLGWGDLSVQGQAKFETPRLDQMAAEGLRFTSHYSGSTVCAPSRAVLMTGKHTGHVAVRGNREYKPLGQFPLPKNEVTVAELLKTVGYETAVIGKWGMGPPGTEGAPLQQGFDHSFGYNCQRNAHFFYRDFLFRDDEKIEIDPEQWTHELLTEDALSWLGERKADTPFFLYLPYTIPHASIEAPQELIDPFIGRWGEEKPFPGRHYSAQPTPHAAFAAMVTQLDADVGKILDLLREKGLAENTLVIFTSDNGPHAEGGADPKWFDSNGPYRGIKRDLYEGGIRVPFLAWWPGTVKPGVTDHASAFWDFLPTACQLAGLPIPAGLDGISYAPTLLGDEQRAHRFLYWEFHERGASQAVRVGKWKGVRTQLRKNPEASLELYDLEADPGETNNLAAEHPEIVQRLMRVIHSQHIADPNWKFPTDPKPEK